MTIQLINSIIVILTWVALIGGLLWLLSLKWKPFVHLKTGYFSLVKMATIGIFNLLFKPTERRGIGNQILNERDATRRP